MGTFLFLLIDAEQIHRVTLKYMENIKGKSCVQYQIKIIQQCRVSIHLFSQNKDAGCESFFTQLSH